MNYHVINEMENALNENNLGKARSILVNSLLSFEDEETMNMLNKLAADNGVFEDDNGEENYIKDKESLGQYIDKIKSGIVENFSKLKYERIREYFRRSKKESQTIDDNGEKTGLRIEFKSSAQRNTKKKAAAAAAIGLAALAFGVKLLGRRGSNRK